MKGSVITTRTWFLLIGAALLISAGLLNFRQRAYHETPPWDGVEWVDTKEGIFARSIERGSAAERAWLLPGDQLIGISLDGNGRPEQIAAARDVQIYLDQAQVGGQLHYLMKRPSYSPEVGAYWADLDHLGAIHKWTPRVIYINLLGLVYLFVGFFVLFKQGGRAPFALHFATFCLAAFVFHFYTPVGPRQRSLHSLCAPLSALLCALPVTTTAFPQSSLARNLVVCSGAPAARLFGRHLPQG